MPQLFPHIAIGLRSRYRNAAQKNLVMSSGIERLSVPLLNSRLTDLKSTWMSSGVLGSLQLIDLPTITTDTDGNALRS
jgi:hypothetical protein